MDNKFFDALHRDDTQVVLVACEDSNGFPDLVPVVRHDSEEDVEEGMHYVYAQEQVANNGYDVYPQAICFDQDDATTGFFGKLAFGGVLRDSDPIEGVLPKNPAEPVVVAIFREEADGEYNYGLDDRPDHEIVDEEFVTWDLTDALEAGWPISEDGSDMTLYGYYNRITEEIRMLPYPAQS